LEHRKAMSTARITQECAVRTWNRNRMRIGTGTGTGTKLLDGNIKGVFVIPKFKHELNSRNIGSQCEAVIAVLQGFMSSKGGTSAGGVKRGVIGV